MSKFDVTVRNTQTNETEVSEQECHLERHAKGNARILYARNHGIPIRHTEVVEIKRRKP